MTSLRILLKAYFDDVNQSLAETNDRMSPAEMTGDKASFVVGVNAALTLIEQGIPLNKIHSQNDRLGEEAIAEHAALMKEQKESVH